ncbi:caspase family protein [Methanothrix sp.]
MRAYAMENCSEAETTDGYLMQLSEIASGDGNACSPQTSINWEYFLSQMPHHEPAVDGTGLDSSNIIQLIHETTAKPRRNRQVSEYERTLEAISAMHATASGGDAGSRPPFEGSSLAIADLKYIYDGTVPSSAPAKAHDFGDGSSYLDYLYQMSIKSMRSDAAQWVPPQATSNSVRSQISDNAYSGEVLNRFASETYQYRKDTVSQDPASLPPDGVRSIGFSAETYSRSISNLARLNSHEPEQDPVEAQSAYPSVTSNLNTLLKDEDESQTIAGKSASIFTEYSMVYTNHSSRKHRSDKIAVVVGVNSYSDRMSLHACVNDARAMAELLEELGYDVVELTDDSPIKPTRENILNVAIARIKGSRGTEKAIFYFSGHGEIDENGTFYMVPQNSRGPSSYISEYDLEMYLKDIKNLAIIIDACHSGGMKDLVSDGQILIASSKNEEPSNELWNGQMSVFTYNLVNAIRSERMRAHDLSLQSCFYRAREGTLKWPGQRLLKQNPVIVDRTGGNFRIT